MIPNKDVFCSSPWLHIRLSYAGNFIPCRWIDRNMYANVDFSIKRHGIMEYFNSPPMIKLRQQLMNGEKPAGCRPCYYEDSVGKLSGRKKQLFRSKLDDEETFEETFHYSPHFTLFDYSQKVNGFATGAPYDLQIDLTNTCNSACIMCHPALSTRLHVDYVKLSKISPLVFAAPPVFEYWANDPGLVQKFVDELKLLPSIEYIHFIGGETLYIESFYTICEALIKADLAKDIIIGTTTNGTVYSDRLENIISEFKACHLGLSIESVTSLNDYIRYPSKVSEVKGMFDNFLNLRSRVTNLHLELRVTPNIFSIFYFDEVVQYMCDNNITAESCNILQNPPCLKIELLPEDLRAIATQKLITVAEKNLLSKQNQTPNTRNSELARQVMANVTYGYIDFLTNLQAPENVEEERFKLVKFLKGFESLRNNSILDYAPEFSDFLKSYGY